MTGVIDKSRRADQQRNWSAALDLGSVQVITGKKTFADLVVTGSADFTGATVSGIPAIADGDKGDVIISVGGTVWEVKESGVDHDALLNFVANEHIDWTADQSPTEVHINNIPDLSTLYESVDPTILRDADIGASVQAHGVVLDDISALGSAAADGEFIVAAGPGLFVYESGATARASLGLTIGTDVQAWGAVLDNLNTLGAPAADGEIIVATGAGAFAYESGATARASLGLGTGDNVEFDIVTGAQFNTNQTGNLADDDVHIITAPTIGLIVIGGRNNTYKTASALIAFRTVATAFTTILAQPAALIEVTTGALTGTTGTDGKVTVSAHTDGNVYIENRFGSTISLSYTFLGE